MKSLETNKIIIIGACQGEIADMRRRIFDLGYDVAAVAESEEEACMLVRAAKPDLALLDFDLNETGVEGDLAGRLARDYDLPVVLMASAATEERERISGNSSYGCLRLPMAARDLHATLQNALLRHQVEVERRRLEQHMLGAQKWESIGLVSQRVAHDFNNVLQAVIGNAQLAALDLPSNPAVQASLDHVVNAAMRGAVLCKQFMSYAATQSLHAGCCELSEVVAETQAMLRAVVSKGVRLEYNLADDLSPIHLAPNIVQQIVMNLVLNASEASEKRPGQIRVTTGRVWLRPHQLAAMTDAPKRPEGEYVFLEVSDQAGGIRPDTAARMFTPFFTTKDNHSGLGLTTTLTHAHAAVGAVSFENREWIGAAFRVYLPVPRTQSAA